MFPGTPREKLIRRSVIAVIVVAAVVLVRHREGLEQLATSVFDSLRGLGPWAPVVVALLYIPACAALLPNSFLSPAAGFLFGPITGTITAIVGLTLGCSSNFLLARGLGRSWFDRNVPENPKFRAVELACRREGFKIVFLTRLTPAFPSNVMSYFFGVTSVSLGRYALGTALGMLPRTLVCTSLGTAAKSLAESAEVSLSGTSWQQYALYAVGTGVTIAVIYLISGIARRALEESLEQSGQPLASPTDPAARLDLPGNDVAVEPAAT